MILKVVVILILFSVVPLCIGKAATAGIQKYYADCIPFWMILGFLIMLGVFQLITVPFTLAEIPFHFLVYLYSAILLLLVVYGGIRYGKLLWNRLYKFIIDRKWLNVVFLLAIILILIQMLISVFTENHMSGDDAAYVVYANDIVYTDSIFGYSPYTGEYAGIGVNKITLTSWCVFMAFLSKISGIPAAVIAHTVLPFMLIGYAYMVYYLMARVLMKDSYTKIGWFLIVLSALHIGGDFSIYTLTFRLLQIQWQGKAVAAAIVVPFLIYYMYVINEEPLQKMEYVNLILISIAAAGCTLVGGGLALMVIVIGSISMAISRRRIGIWLRSMLCCIPCGLYCAAFLFQYTLTAWLRG